MKHIFAIFLTTTLLVPTTLASHDTKQDARCILHFDYHKGSLSKAITKRAELPINSALKTAQQQSFPSYNRGAKPQTLAFPAHPESMSEARQGCRAPRGSDHGCLCLWAGWVEMHDYITGERLSATDRALAGAGVLGGPFVKGIKYGIKAGKLGQKIANAVRKAGRNGSNNASKKFSKEKQALVEMAKKDKKAGGITRGDMDAYKQLNKELPDPFPKKQVRGPEKHPNRGPHAQREHGHVGPVDHIPINP